MAQDLLNQIKSRSARRYEETKVQNVTVRLQSISERERSRYEASFLDASGVPVITRLADIKSKLIALCVVDEEGKRILSEDDAAELDSSFSSALYDACVAHCGISSQDDLTKKN